MKYKFLIPMLMSVALLNACKKDNSSSETPGDKILDTYIPGTTLEVKEIAIYTNNQVITDGATIQEFLNRNFDNEVKSKFYLGLTSVTIPESSQYMHLLDHNRVNVNGANMQIMGYKDSMMIVSEYTTTAFPASGSACAAVVNKVAQYNPYTECPDGMCRAYRKTSPLITNGVNFYVPLLTYIVKSGDCITVPSETPMVNIKNIDLQSHLEVIDTVLIQYAKLPMVKQAKN